MAPRITGQDLSGWRARMRVTQAELAAELGYDVSTIKRWERGAAPVPPVVDLALGMLALLS